MKDCLRSRLLWLGMFPVVLLLWAWWDSVRYCTGGLFEVPGSGSDHYVGGSNSCGRIQVIWIHDESRVAGLDTELVRRPNASVDDLNRVIPEETVSWRHYHLDHRSPRVVNVEVAHWLLLVIYQSVLAGMMWWWIRRKHRLTAPQEDMDSAT